MSDRRRIRMKVEVFTLTLDEKQYNREEDKEQILEVTLCIKDAAKLMELLNTTMKAELPFPTVDRP